MTIDLVDLLVRVEKQIKKSENTKKIKIEAGVANLKHRIISNTKSELINKIMMLMADIAVKYVPESGLIQFAIKESATPDPGVCGIAFMIFYSEKDGSNEKILSDRKIAKIYELIRELNGKITFSPELSKGTSIAVSFSTKVE